MRHAANACAVLVFTALFGYMLIGMRETGPNCPYKDPAWVGYCDDTP